MVEVRPWILGEGMAVEASLPAEGGTNLVCARKECYGCWEVPWGSFLQLGLSLAVPIWAPEAIPSMAVCQEFVGVGMPGR